MRVREWGFSTISYPMVMPDLADFELACVYAVGPILLHVLPKAKDPTTVSTLNLRQDTTLVTGKTAWDILLLHLPQGHVHRVRHCHPQPGTDLQVIRKPSKHRHPAWSSTFTIQQDLHPHKPPSQAPRNRYAVDNIGLSH